MKTDFPFKIEVVRTKLDPIERAFMSAEAIDRIWQVEFPAALSQALREAFQKGVVIRSITITGNIEVGDK
jgi:hypothetical protein